MTPEEMALRIGDLETALRLVVFVWVVSVVLLVMLPSCDCDPKHTCSTEARCPLCFKRHDPKERCA